MKKVKHYDITATKYWRKWRQGRREKGAQGNYSRAKRNNDIRWGARNNIKGHGTLGRAVYCKKGYIRLQRLCLENDQARTIKLMREIGLLPAA